MPRRGACCGQAGGYVFNVWDGLGEQPRRGADRGDAGGALPGAAAGLHRPHADGPQRPARLRDDLAAAGFTACRIETVPATWHAASARDAAIGYCQGCRCGRRSRRRTRQEPGRATEAAARAIAARYGEGPIATAIQALVVETQA